MKKLLLTTSMVVLAGASLLAQGTVNFGNVGAPISNGVSLAVLPSGTQFRAALYYLPTNNYPQAPTWLDFESQAARILLPNATTFSLAGAFTAGTRTTPDTTAPGGDAWFQVRAWETAYGTSYEQARDSGRPALIGTSGVVKVRTGIPPNVAPGSLVAVSTSLPGYGGLKGFYVYPVPEPSLLGLGVLGIGALLLLRRRK